MTRRLTPRREPAFAGASAVAAPSLPERERFLAWPGLASLKLTLPLSYLFFKIFYSVYGGTSLLAKLRRPHVGFHFPWEMRLPFLPSWTLVYLSVPLLLLLTPFILRSWRAFMPFVLTLTAETLVAGVFFLALPLGQAFPPRVAQGALGGLFHLADRLNLDYNKFPSLLMAFAATAAVVFGRRCGWVGRTLFALWVVAVGASAMLIHEHQVLDLAAGLALGLAGVATVQGRASDERSLEALRIDAFCLGEFSAFVRWRARPLADFLALSRASLFRWRATRPLRAAYCVARHADDALRGRPRGTAEPRETVGSLLRVLAGEAPAGEMGVEQLAAYLAAELKPGPRRALAGLLGEILAEATETRRRLEILPAVRGIFQPPSGPGVSGPPSPAAARRSTRSRCSPAR